MTCDVVWISLTDCRQLGDVTPARAGVKIGHYAKLRDHLSLLSFLQIQFPGFRREILPEAAMLFFAD
jgi:hypothetical protein